MADRRLPGPPPAEFGFITALKAPQIRKLVKEGAVQLSVFDEMNLAEIACEKLHPGQRLVVCRNPLVAEERARKRTESCLKAPRRIWLRSSIALTPARLQGKPRSALPSVLSGAAAR